MTDELLTAEEIGEKWMMPNEGIYELIADVQAYGEHRAAEARKTAPQGRPCGHYVHPHSSYCKACHEIAEARRAALEPILEMVNVQADDEGLWFDASQISGRQGYLQDELRKLHALIGQLAASPAPEGSQ